MTLRTRHRRWFALLALFGLLFQQVAMAGYRCPMQDDSGPSMLMGGGASGCECPDDSDRARCKQHCAPTDSLTGSDHVPGVPALAATMPSWLERSSRDRRVSDEALGATMSVRAAAPLVDRLCKRLI